MTMCKAYRLTFIEPESPGGGLLFFSKTGGGQLNTPYPYLLSFILPVLSQLSRVVR